MRKNLVAAVAVVLVAGLWPAPVAGAAQAPGNVLMPKVSPAAGWQTPAFGTNYSAIGEKFSSAAVGDLDGNGVPDIVAGFPDGNIYAWRTDNGARWFQFWTGPGAVQASPVLIDYNRDGRLDIVYANTHGDVGAVGIDGRRYLTAKIGPDQPWGGAFATPAVADIDGNGNLEVIVTGFDGYVHIWMENGYEFPSWPKFLQDTSWSSPAVGDIDGDGKPEIVAGYDCDGAPGQSCAPNYGGYVGAWNPDGTNVPGWPKFIAKQVVWSSPALADLDGDGQLDVVVGQGNMPGTMWDNYAQKMNGQYVYAFRGDGSNLPGWPVAIGRNVTSSPAIGDITGDGRPDVAVVAEDGLLYALGGNGQKLWTRCAGNDPNAAPNTGPGTGNCPVLHASASIADIDNDGRQNVVIGGEQWVRAYDPNGDLRYSGESAGYTDPMTAVPTVASVGGKTWIVEVSANTVAGNYGRVFAWTTNTALGRADWPTFKGNSARSGSSDVYRAQLEVFKNTYSDTLYKVVSGRAVAIGWMEWATSGYPAPQPTWTDFVKYPWAPSIYGVTFWPGAWQWDHLSWDQWSRAGFPQPRAAGWIAGSDLYKKATEAAIFVKDPDGLVHQLNWDEWRAMDFRSPRIV